MSNCVGVTPDGSPCPAHPVTGSQYCVWHDPAPEAVAKAQLARIQGGLRRRQLSNSEFPGAVSDVDGLLKIWNLAIADAWQIEGSINRAHAITALIRAGAEILSLTDISAKLELLSGLLHGSDKA